MADARAVQAREANRLAGLNEQQAKQHRAVRNRLVRELRAEDPERWTWTALARVVGITPELAAAIVKRQRETTTPMAESAKDTRRRELAALLIELHDEARSTQLRRADVLDRWVRTYPEHAVQRAGVARGGGPGSRAGARIRRGLAEWEQEGAVRRQGDLVVLLDVRALRVAADEEE